MNTQFQSEQKRKYFPVLINGKIKYIRDRKDYRELNQRLKNKLYAARGARGYYIK